MFKKIIDAFFNRHIENNVEKNVKEDIFLIPISGQVIDLDDVPDEVFSKRMMVNLEEVENKVPSIITPVIFTNLNGKNLSYNAGKFGAKEKNVVIIK